MGSMDMVALTWSKPGSLNREPSIAHLKRKGSSCPVKMTLSCSRTDMMLVMVGMAAMSRIVGRVYRKAIRAPPPATSQWPRGSQSTLDRWCGAKGGVGSVGALVAGVKDDTCAPLRGSKNRRQPSSEAVTSCFVCPGTYFISWMTTLGPPVFTVPIFRTSGVLRSWTMNEPSVDAAMKRWFLSVSIAKATLTELLSGRGISLGCTPRTSPVVRLPSSHTSCQFHTCTRPCAAEMSLLVALWKAVARTGFVWAWGRENSFTTDRPSSLTASAVREPSRWP
mmetsp:Transcript_5/g.18  ORF Transcript_5/g.18 Transcript_5/m.18 type:complete len:279 (-) Transcript_5:172-1008(-)